MALCRGRRRSSPPAPAPWTPVVLSGPGLPGTHQVLVNKYCLAEMGRTLFAEENEVRAEQSALALPREFGTDKFQTNDTVETGDPH
jgi:hypothetical protein